MKYYIADTHFGHENIIKLCGRPFADAEEMDRVIIENWNSVVNDNDDVYIVGDFSHKSEKPVTGYLKQLKGRKHLIAGNHDKIITADPEASSYFASISQMEVVRDHGHTVFLCHYPVAEWPGYYDGFYHFFGHIHKTRNEACMFMEGLEKAYNVGADLLGFTPRTIDEIITRNR